MWAKSLLPNGRQTRCKLQCIYVIDRRDCRFSKRSLSYCSYRKRTQRAWPDERRHSRPRHWCITAAHHSLCYSKGGFPMAVCASVERQLSFLMLHLIVSFTLAKLHVMWLSWSRRLQCGIRPANLHCKLLIGRGNGFRSDCCTYSAVDCSGDLRWARRHFGHAGLP